MNWWGEDFIKARKAWLYPTEPMQSPWRAVPIAVVLFLLFAVLQGVFGVLADVVFYHANAASLQNLRGFGGGTDLSANPDMANFLKASILGMFPAAVVTTFLAVAASHLGLSKNMGTIPLQWPKIGPLGWISILAAFWFSMQAFSMLFFGVFAAEPNQSGLVEKALTSIAAEKSLFAIALPGAVLGAPLVEEVLFRGILFAGLLRTPLGKVGTVIVTSALWAAAHLGAAPLIFAGVIFFMGLMLGVLLLRFGSLWVTIACHTVWNLVVTLVLFHAGTGQ